MSFTSAMSAVTPINLTSGKLDIKTEEGEESLAGHTAIKADCGYKCSTPDNIIRFLLCSIFIEIGCLFGI